MLGGSTPIEVVNPAPQLVKQIQHTFSYADLVAMASGANPFTIVPAVGGKIHAPLIFSGRTVRPGVTAGTTTNLQVRYSGNATNLLSGSITASFGNGPGAALTQDSLNVPCNITVFTGTANVLYSNTAMVIVNTGAMGITGITGSLLTTLVYVSYGI